HEPASAAQHEPELQLRGRRVADHGAQGSGGFLRFRLYLGLPGTVLRAARPGAQRRAGPQFHPLHLRPFHHRGRSGLRRAEGAPGGGQAARTLPAVGYVQRGRRSDPGRMAGALRRRPARDSRGVAPWLTVTRSSTTTKTPATSASSTPKTRMWAPAWWARPPVAT